jgi:uncharacterized SAM-binding protein YcdF (DUF218 family)
MNISSRLKRTRRGRILMAAVVILFVWCLVAWIAARALIVRMPLERADAIVVLSGSAAYVERTRWAAHLYSVGRAPVIILTNDNQMGGWSEAQQRNPLFSERARDELLAAGVPASRIEIAPGAITNTYDECVSLREHAERRGQRSLLIVTSAYHSRRALWTLEQVFRGSGISLGMETVMPGEQMPSPGVWWFSRSGWRGVALEYPKLVYYWLKYRRAE